MKTRKKQVLIVRRGTKYLIKTSGEGLESYFFTDDLKKAHALANDPRGTGLKMYVPRSTAWYTSYGLQVARTMRAKLAVLDSVKQEVLYTVGGDDDKLYVFKDSSYLYFGRYGQLWWTTSYRSCSNADPRKYALSMHDMWKELADATYAEYKAWCGGGVQ